MQPANDFEIDADGTRFSSVGLDTFTAGSAADDRVKVSGWQPRHLVFSRSEKGWTVKDNTGAGMLVNGASKTQWRIASRHTLGSGSGMVQVWPLPNAAAPENAAPVAPAPAPPLPSAAMPSPVQSPPAVTRRTQKVAPRYSGQVTVGRSSFNDIVVDDLRVAPAHARFEIGPTTKTVEDLGSRLGTYVDGVRVVNKMELTPGQVITVGNVRFRLDQVGPDPGLAQLGGGVELIGAEICVEIGDKKIVQAANVRAASGELIAVLGPSGSGKSTVVRAMAGMQPLASGSVTVNGENLYGPNAALRQQLGYVPQDDILHTSLAVISALAYAADLRFPDTTPFPDRQERVGEVIRDLGLEDHSETTVGSLSGGQRKRVNVATELLTAPELMFLDEPTSGLDPGYEKEVMLLLRRLADEGRAVIVVTHSLQSLDVVDKLLIMGRGGQQAYFGPPDQALDYFGADSLADIFIRLEHQPIDWQQNWRTAHPPTAAHALPTSAARPDRAPPIRSAKEQLVTLVRRYIEVLTRDRRQIALTLAQGPIIALLMVMVMGKDHLVGGSEPSSTSKAAQVLLAMTLGAVYVGASSSVREIVKELPILRRERNAGLGFGPYISSKVAVLGAVTLLQSFVLVAVGNIRQGGPMEATFFGDGRLELVVAVSLTGLSSMALGLFVSSMVREQDKAMLVLPILLFSQFVLSGVSFELNNPVLRLFSALMPARWGFAATASTADLGALNGLCPDRPSGCPGSWTHGSPEWFSSILMLAVLTALYIGMTYAMLNRRERNNSL